MTVVVALLEDNAILIGSDSRRSGEGGHDQTVMKLRRIPGAPVAWGCANNSEIGERFSAWLEGYRWPPKHWNAFERAVRTKIAALNNEQRTYTTGSGVEWEDEYGLTCLVAVSIGGKQYVAAYYPDGQKGSLEYGEFEYIGTGRYVAFASYVALRHIQEIPNEVRMHIILNTASQLGPGCGLPYNLWRVKSDGAIEDIPMVSSIPPASQSGTSSNAP